LDLRFSREHAVGSRRYVLSRARCHRL
jgi:hypothetical protein